MSIGIKKFATNFIFEMKSTTQLGNWMKENPEITGCAFFGRSNVGKSSLINALFGKKSARVSKTPGRTQSVNIFNFEVEGLPGPLWLFDLPGYGFAKVSKKESANWGRLMETFFRRTRPGIGFNPLAGRPSSASAGRSSVLPVYE